jgi:hypothetical protein
MVQFEPQRRILPQRRANHSFEIDHGGHRFIVTAGYFEDGLLGEMFMTGRKVGSDADVLVCDAAILFSLAIQYGAPLEVMQKALKREPNGAPASPIGRAVDALLKPVTLPTN